MVSKKDYIQEAAYFIWLNRGRPENQDLAIWDEATKLYELTHSEEKSESKEFEIFEFVKANKAIIDSIKDERTNEYQNFVDAFDIENI